MRKSPICRDGCYMPQLCSGHPAKCLMRPRAYYPMFADLNGRPCVVVGGGLVAQRKVTTLLRYGAKLTLISPQLTRRLAAYARHGRIRHLARRFRPADVRGAWLVYAATDDARINHLVFRSAQRQRVFANVVDQKPLCSFIAPAILTRGPLTVAVSTGGASPTLAKRLKRELGEQLGRQYGPLLKLLTGLRGIAKRKLPNYHDRKRYFDAVVRRGPSATRRQALTLLEQYAAK
ncbi:MAG: bifunctional precorrin-2 dehydrogenase/sirohydrochlorin ferrochelatase [Candidatus Omnitrophica bacterium]|nr:bifunctional precorrin-2 dehydrogenase/sirohydrochlorin ferrochelatase [Candidatus Omnitrophota bacterium]